jgi:hypothetical protein
MEAKIFLETTVRGKSCRTQAPTLSQRQALQLASQFAFNNMSNRVVFVPPAPAARDAADAKSKKRREPAIPLGAQEVVVPGEVLASADAAMLRGHGTLERAIFSDQPSLISTNAGVVSRVNKLVAVRPLHARYAPEIGDVVVGRVTEVAQKRWKVDINSRQDGILMLSAINLPGGVLVCLDTLRNFFSVSLPASSNNQR